MSLKAFHVFFVAMSILFTIGLGIWGIRDYRASDSMSSLWLGMGAFAGGIVLLVYGRWFLRKLKHVSYI